jgi:ribosomal protein S18 acetylase RimI-like enzyme
MSQTDKTSKRVRARSDYVIRQLRARDIGSINKLYDLLSNESKRFFHPDFLEKSSPRSLAVQAALILSTFKMIRIIELNTIPKLCFLSLVIVDERDKIIGFAFLKFQKRLAHSGHSAELGICINDKYQGGGLGSALMSELLDLGKKQGVEKIFLSVLLDNIKGIRLYSKYGFRTTGKSVDNWKGSKLSSLKMNLLYNSQA